MNRLERTINKYESNINFVYKTDMPPGLDALTVGNNVFLTTRCGFTDTLQHVGEEIGHVQTTVGNISKYKTADDLNQERKARQRGYCLIVDLDSIIACYQTGIRTPWEMSDFFEVSESYMWKAIDTYRIKRGIDFTYKGYKFNLNNGLTMSKI
ncbi:hypothetical protein [Companilactobacillus farciminis]|uniref:hypothetical protein n=1 Tax=Companilactobacillus farciminis TaxID=1612 RepID=UPI001915FEE1|nr:hypothetical protein [Companilactobacillus farciminis]